MATTVIFDWPVSVSANRRCYYMGWLRLKYLNIRLSGHVSELTSVSALLNL